MECLQFVFSPLIQYKLDRLTEEWNAHKIRKSNHSFVSGSLDELYFFSKSLGYEQCGKNVAIPEINEVVNESNVHLDFQGIQTTTKPDLVNYFKYFVEGNNELYLPMTWDGAKKFYQYIIESAALV